MKPQKKPKAGIDLHVHLVGLAVENEAYSLSDVVEAAENKGINVLGVVEHNGDIFPLIGEKAWNMPDSKYYARAENGHCIAIFNKQTGNTTYMLKASEFMTGDKNGKENFHLIGVGDISGLQLSNERPFPKTEKCIEALIQKDALAIIDHPYVNARFIGKSITKEKEKELEGICKEFKGDISLEWNAQCIPALRFFTEAVSSLVFRNLTGYHANRNAEKLADKLRDYKIRVVADSDVHVWNKRLMNGIGAGHIEIFREGMDYSSGKAIVKSIKSALKIGEGGIFGYKNIKDYVSPANFTEAIGVPYVLNLERNRG